MQVRWSRWDQLSLEALLWTLPGLALLQVVVRLAGAVRGDPLTSTGHLPGALVPTADPVVGPLTGGVVVDDPTAAQYGWSLVPPVALLVLAVVVARLLLGVVSSLRHGDPFTTGNARRLAVLSAVVLVGGLLVQLLDSVAHARTIASVLPDRPVIWQVDLPLWPALAGAALLAFLAEVFARGARLREDVEGLV